MKITIDNVEIDINKLSQETKDSLLRALEGDGRFVPEDCDKYWLIDNFGEVYFDIWVSGEHNQYRLSQGNVFRTEAEAQKHLEYLKAVAVIRADAEFWEPKLEDYKYYGYYTDDDDFYGALNCENAYIPGVIYFKTKEALEQSFKTHEKEWRIYCGLEAV